jgi:hypothetical protein
VGAAGARAPARGQRGQGNKQAWELYWVPGKMPEWLDGWENKRAQELGVDGQWQGGGSLVSGCIARGVELWLLL